MKYLIIAVAVCLARCAPATPEPLTPEQHAWWVVCVQHNPTSTHTCAERAREILPTAEVSK